MTSKRDFFEVSHALQLQKRFGRIGERFLISLLSFVGGPLGFQQIEQGAGAVLVAVATGLEQAVGGFEQVSFEGRQACE